METLTKAWEHVKTNWMWYTGGIVVIAAVAFFWPSNKPQIRK